MGNKQTIFDQDELDDYRRVTYLNDDEIIECYKKFDKLISNQDGARSRKSYLTQKQFEKSPNFRANPFRDQIFKVFASHHDGMSFDDYLNMMSVFSEKAPSSIKCRYAFQIYKLDDKSKKDRLTQKDIKLLIYRLVGSENAKKITKEDINLLVDIIFEEANFYKTGSITLDEFEHIVLKSIEFPMNFCIRI